MYASNRLALRPTIALSAALAFAAAPAGAGAPGTTAAPANAGAPAGAGGEELPRTWFDGAKTASELGITAFQQSPLLDDRDLPPVAERLPDDPVVIEPLRKIGKYGGTARIALDDSWQFFNWEPAVTIGADMRTTLPNLAQRWTISEDGRILTIYLRKGLRWSDGHPLTADDFGFNFNNIWMDKEMSPVTSRMVFGGTFVKIDDLTFQYVFDEPNPGFINFFAQYGSHFADPKHFLERYHPMFSNREALERYVKDEGFISWMALMVALRGWSNERAAEVPTLRAYRVKRRTLTMMRLERNPYYFKVDPAGNQLPYIDAVDAEIILDNSELVTAMAATGQLDFAAFSLRTQDIPLLKLGERDGVAKVLIWTRLHISDVAIQPNYNYADKKLANLLWDKRFRIALSHAINRDEMNDIIYFGRGVPSQVTVHPTSVFYDPANAARYANYDPDYANALLDELGLEDSDGDGLREYPDGEQLVITMEFLDFETPKAITMELVADYWRAVGVDLRLKQVDRSLQSARAQAGEMQMTLWHADKVMDVLFPLLPDWFVPHRAGWDIAMWNDWARYYQTKGRIGEEPPPVIKQIHRWNDQFREATDPAERMIAGQKIVDAASQNLWTIGTVGQAPHPVVISRRLKNVPTEGIWGWDNRWTLAYHPSTWYFDGD